MKKFSVLLLTLVVVFGMGAFAFAEKEFCGLSETEGTLGVSAEFLPYAKVTCEDGDAIDFGQICAAPGIYIADGDLNHQPAGLVMTDFVCGDNGTVSVLASDFSGSVTPDWSAYDRKDGNWNGWGEADVESNCDVEVTMHFNPTDWMNSDTVFAVNRNWGINPGYFTSLDAGSDATWLHSFNPADSGAINDTNPQRYYIDGALLVESAIQNAAKEYTGEIVVTLALPTA